MLDERKTVKHRKQNSNVRLHDNNTDIMLFTWGIPTTTHHRSSPAYNGQKPRILPFRKRWNWDAYIVRSSKHSLAFWIGVTLATIVLFAEELIPSMISEPRPHQHHARQAAVTDKEKDMSDSNTGTKVLHLTHPDTIIFRGFFATTQKRKDDATISSLSSFDRGLNNKIQPYDGGRDFGNLKKTITYNLENPKNVRDPIIGIAIDPDDYQRSEEYREYILQQPSSGISSSSSTVPSRLDPVSDRVDVEMRCRPVSWIGYSFPSCNQVHELLVERVPDSHCTHQPYNVSYIKSGHSREAWLFESWQHDDDISNNFDRDHPFTVKRLKLRSRYSWGAVDLSKNHNEAIILERLLPSPHIVDIYGYCGTTIVSEALTSGLQTRIRLDPGLVSRTEPSELVKLFPQNNLTASEKLQISLDMAEALAAIHGFEGGPIVHRDNHLGQWLLAPDGTVKLIDFGEAKNPEWDAKAGSFCAKLNISRIVPGATREELLDDESVDTCGYLINVYTILTGLRPFHHEKLAHLDRKEKCEMIEKSTRPFVDPRYQTRSFIEANLAQLLTTCWEYDQRQEKRPSIFDIVSFLRKVKQSAANRGELHQSDFIKVTF